MKFITALLVPFILSTPALCQARVKLANVGTIAFDCGRMPLPWKGQNLSCDEFPFANVREADQGGQNNRCVPSGENNSQGGTLSAFIRAKTEFIKNQPPFLYNIAFTGANKIQYCFDAGANTCNADANQFIGKAVAPNGGKWVTPFRRREADLVPSTFNQYMSKRGELFTSARRMEAGEKLYHARMDPVAEAAALENPDEDARNAFYANPDNYELVEDEVERPVTREEAATLP
ncbi:hypothetical protein SLS64_006309 [Diaporthe eres]|uniref:Deoxyribonuclease NucA/NucB domain-containing protein n=1 Tax=Diaporthe eres TaxID=83184 RepID=A0ABR1NXF4_DIAER